MHCLHCSLNVYEAEGPVITWKDNAGNTIEQGDGYVLAYGGRVLTITNLTENQDNHTYTCQVHNRLGVARSTMKLTVTCVCFLFPGEDVFDMMARMGARIHSDLRTRTHTHTHTHTHTWTHTRTCTHTQTHTLTHPHTHTHGRTCARTLTHVYTHTRTRTHGRKHARTLTHTCLRTHTRTRIQTHVRTQKHTQHAHTHTHTQL